MYSVPTEVAAIGRARWLAELSRALAEAQRLLIELGCEGELRSPSSELFIRIQAAMIEVQSLRLSHAPRRREQFNPEWMNSQPWSDGHNPCGRSPPPANGSR